MYLNEHIVHDHVVKGIGPLGATTNPFNHQISRLRSVVTNYYLFIFSLRDRRVGLNVGDS